MINLMIKLRSRKINALVALSLSILGLSSTTASAEVAVDKSSAEKSKVYYKDGVMFDSSAFNLKLNLLLTSRFTYSDLDQAGRRNSGLAVEQDTAGFDLDKVRLILGGDALEKRFSYRLQTDLRNDAGGSDLKDAWLQFNSTDSKARFGQFKVPFSRQENEGDQDFQFMDRSEVSNIFSPSRNMGAMVFGQAGESSNFYLGAYNGESDGEGRNKPAVDNKVAGYAAFNANFGDYGSRSYEADWRKDTSSLAFTSGAALIYGEAQGDPLGLDETADFRRVDLNVDGGLRYQGFAAQTEFYYSHLNLDGLSTVEDKADLFGFYVQGGYLFDKTWELASRFGYFQGDSELSAVDSQEEYNLCLSYFLNGNNLKVQTGLTFLESSFQNSSVEDLSDFRVETQLVGYL